MIFGIGQDICNSKRIEAILNRFSDRFKNRIYTSIEIKKCDSRKIMLIHMLEGLQLKKLVLKL